MQKEMVDAFAYFGINVQQEFDNAANREEVKKRLENIVKKAKAEYKRLALQHHPDKNGGDDTKMKELNDVWTFLQQAGIMEKPKSQPMAFYQGYSNSSTTTTTTSDSSFSFFIKF